MRLLLLLCVSAARPQVLPGGGRVSFLHRLGSDRTPSPGGCREAYDSPYSYNQRGVELTASWFDAAGGAISRCTRGGLWSSSGNISYYKAQVRNVSLWLTAPTGGHSVVLRWEQRNHYGPGYAGWMLDDIRIDSQCECSRSDLSLVFGLGL